MVSTSWQLLEDMGAEGATFGPVIRVGGRGKKSPGEGLRSCLEGARGKVIGHVWQCRRQPLLALCDVVLRVLLEDMGAEGATFGPVIRVGGRGKKSPGGVSWQGHGERC